LRTQGGDPLSDRSEHRTRKGSPRNRTTSVKSCRILVNGKEIKKVEAKNGFVTCTATYPNL
jgi:hypothetical protein